MYTKQLYPEAQGASLKLPSKIRGLLNKIKIKPQSYLPWWICASGGQVVALGGDVAAQSPGQPGHQAQASPHRGSSLQGCAAPRASASINMILSHARQASQGFGCLHWGANGRPCERWSVDSGGLQATFATIRTLPQALAGWGNGFISHGLVWRMWK